MIYLSMLSVVCMVLIAIASAGGFEPRTGLTLRGIQRSNQQTHKWKKRGATWSKMQFAGVEKSHPWIDKRVQRGTTWSKMQLAGVEKGNLWINKRVQRGMPFVDLHTESRKLENVFGRKREKRDCTFHLVLYNTCTKVITEKDARTDKGGDDVLIGGKTYAAEVALKREKLQR